MSQTLTIHNPTGEGVAYMSRDCRLAVPASKTSTHTLKDDVAARVTAYFKRHHPLFTIEVASDAPGETAAPVAGDKAAADTAKKPAAPRQTAKAKADAKTKADAAADDKSQEAASK